MLFNILLSEKHTNKYVDNIILKSTILKYEKDFSEIFVYIIMFN